MPMVGDLQLVPGDANNPKNGFRSAFSHANETTEADYYKVLLDDDNIWAEMTATTRVGFHQYTFPKSDNAHIILDLMHAFTITPIRMYGLSSVSSTTIQLSVIGKQTAGHGRGRCIFAMEFSKPFYIVRLQEFWQRGLQRILAKV